MTMKTNNTSMTKITIFLVFLIVLVVGYYSYLSGRSRTQQQEARSVHDAGMGDPLYHHADRLRVLVERHLLHTGSSRAKELLDDWEANLAKFVAVMPRDYRAALQAIEAERNAAAMEAAE